MQNILCAADYPNLNTLGLYNMNEYLPEYLFTDKTLSSGAFKNQITTLLIKIDNNNIT
ncbi:unnamed protein product, partial [Rotaria magnacalcarata]